MHKFTSNNPVPLQSTFHTLCHRCFYRLGDLKRHKCMAERQNPTKDQQGAVKCSQCQQWFKEVESKSAQVQTIP